MGQLLLWESCDAGISGPPAEGGAAGGQHRPPSQPRAVVIQITIPVIPVTVLSEDGPGPGGHVQAEAVVARTPVALERGPGPPVHGDAAPRVAGTLVAPRGAGGGAGEDHPPALVPPDV